MKKALFLAAIILAFVVGRVIAADNAGVTPGSGKIIGCKEVSTICYVQHILVNSSAQEVGSPTSPFTVQGLTWTTRQSITSNSIATYQAGFTVGAVASFTAPTVGAGGQVIVTYASLRDKNGAVNQPINANVDILLFDACPVASGVCNTGSSTFTDGAFYSIASADIPKLIGRITVQCGVIGVAGTAVNSTALGECSASNLATPITIASGQTVYYVLISDGGRVQASTSDLFLSIAGTL